MKYPIAISHRSREVFLVSIYLGRLLMFVILYFSLKSLNFLQLKICELLYTRLSKGLWRDDYPEVPLMKLLNRTLLYKLTLTGVGMVIKEVYS